MNFTHGWLHVIVFNYYELKCVCQRMQFIPFKPSRFCQIKSTIFYHSIRSSVCVFSRISSAFVMFLWKVKVAATQSRSQMWCKNCLRELSFHIILDWQHVQINVKTAAFTSFLVKLCASISALMQPLNPYNGTEWWTRSIVIKTASIHAIWRWMKAHTLRFRCVNRQIHNNM